jgi:site-specific DNA recombinase
MQDKAEQRPFIRAVLYAAKSTQDRHKSIPTQLDDCRQKATEEGWTVVGEYYDEGFSAYSRSRGPGLAEARERCRRAAAASARTAMLVAQHSDRFSRGAGDKPGAPEALSEIWHAERRHDVHLRSVQDDFDLRDSASVANIGARNHADSERKAAATAAGKRRTAERGEWQGIVPDGYMTVRAVTGAIVARSVEFNLERFEIYRLLWDLATEDATVNAIVRELAAKGYRTAPYVNRGKPKPFDASRVQKALSNSFYAGVLEHKGQVIGSGYWPHYVAPDDFERLRTERSKRRRHRPNPVGRPPGGLLAGLARCGECGAAAVHHCGNARKDGTRPRRYTCETHKQRPGVVDGCSALPYDAELAESTILSGLDELLAESSAVTNAITGARNAKRGNLTADVDAAVRELAECESMIVDLTSRFDAAVLAGNEAGVVLAEGALAQRRAARQRATTRYEDATRALAALAEQPEEDAQQAIARLGAVLGSALSNAQGDVQSTNAALREHFDRFYLYGRGERVVPVLNDEASWRIPAERIADGSLKLNVEEYSVGKASSGELRITPTGRVRGVGHGPDGAPALVQPHVLEGCRSPSGRLTKAKSASTKKFGFSAKLPSESRRLELQAIRREQTLDPDGSARSSGSRVRRPTRTTRLMVYDIVGLHC